MTFRLTESRREFTRNINESKKTFSTPIRKGSCKGIRKGPQKKVRPRPLQRMNQKELEGRDSGNDGCVEGQRGRGGKRSAVANRGTLKDRFAEDQGDE